MVNWVGHYDTIYAHLGVDATLVIAGTPHSLTVIDKTAGVQIAEGGDLSITTIEPACAVRTAELGTKGIDLTQLKGGSITFNGKAWRIENRQTRPSPHGEMIGEVYLILTEDDNGSA